MQSQHACTLFANLSEPTQLNGGKSACTKIRSEFGKEVEDLQASCQIYAVSRYRHHSHTCSHMQSHKRLGFNITIVSGAGRRRGLPFVGCQRSQAQRGRQLEARRALLIANRCTPIHRREIACDFPSCKVLGARWLCDSGMLPIIVPGPSAE